nr:ATP-binding protein [Lentzea albidocapillata]
MINQRYLKSSTILTTNVGIADWATAFGNATVAAAMLDRLFWSHVRSAERRSSEDVESGEHAEGYEDEADGCQGPSHRGTALTAGVDDGMLRLLRGVKDCDAISWLRRVGLTILRCDLDLVAFEGREAEDRPGRRALPVTTHTRSVITPGIWAHRARSRRALISSQAPYAVHTNPKKPSARLKMKMPKPMKITFRLAMRTFSVCPGQQQACHAVTSTSHPCSSGAAAALALADLPGRQLGSRQCSIKSTSAR